MAGRVTASGVDSRLPFFAVSLAWVAIVFSPVIMILVEVIGAVSTDPSLLLLTLPTDRRLGLLVSSLGLSTVVSLASVVVGALAGSVLWRWDTGLKSRLRWMFLAFVPIPPYIHALSWMTAFNWVNITFGFTLPTTGWPMTYFVEFMTYLPLGVGLALVGFLSVDAAMVEVGRLHRTDVDIFMRVVLPLVAPALVAAGGLIFAFSITDYSVPTLFSVNVYSLEVFSDFSATNQAARALILSLPLVIATLLVLWASQRALRSTLQREASQRAPPRLESPLWLGALQWAALLILFAQVLVLLLSLLAATSSPGNMAYAVSSAAGDIGFTLFQAALTSILCMPLALIAAERLKSGGGLWWMLVLAPLGIPSPLIGIGVIRVVSATSVFYGSWLSPVLGTLVRFTPVAALVVLAHLKRSDPLLFDAAELYRRSLVGVWGKIKLPLQASGLIAAAGLVFAFTFGEMGSTLLTVPPGVGTVTLRVFNYLHYGGSDVVAGLCLMMVVFMMVAGLIGLASIGQTSGGTET
jgi:iron(III) transport system permease protein